MRRSGKDLRISANKRGYNITLQKCNMRQTSVLHFNYVFAGNICVHNGMGIICRDQQDPVWLFQTADMTRNLFVWIMSIRMFIRV